MSKTTYYYLWTSLILGMQIFLVIALFRWISDKQMAATIAGICFVGLPIAFLYLDYKLSSTRFIFWLSILGSLQFLLLFAIPILYLRIANWGQAFADLSFFGFTAESLHSSANKSYGLLLITRILLFSRSLRQDLKQK